ncbi:MAG: hypothetical protein HUK28_00775 [Methanobrevibacter sp.]|nr:hypothetical protein [Methanobrevibacter sp.]
MSFEVLAVLFVLSGFFMKFSDDAYDVSNNKFLASIFGIICGVVTGIATILSGDAACIFIGILVGNLLAFKIDGIHHIITLVVFLVIALILGIPGFSIIALVFCIVSAFVDEVGHDFISKKSSNKVVNLFFEYRFTMKVVILLLAIFQIFSFWIFICFILFELAYLFGEFAYQKII